MSHMSQDEHFMAAQHHIKQLRETGAAIKTKLDEAVASGNVRTTARVSQVMYNAFMLTIDTLESHHKHHELRAEVLNAPVELEPSEKAEEAPAPLKKKGRPRTNCEVCRLGRDKCRSFGAPGHLSVDVQRRIEKKPVIRTGTPECLLKRPVETQKPPPYVRKPRKVRKYKILHPEYENQVFVEIFPQKRLPNPPGFRDFKSFKHWSDQSKLYTVTAHTDDVEEIEP